MHEILESLKGGEKDYDKESRMYFSNNTLIFLVGNTTFAVSLQSLQNSF